MTAIVKPMTDIHIPPEALEKGHAEWFRLIKAGATTDVALAAAFRAIVEGWPGMEHHPTHEGYPAWPHIILPLEAPNPTFTSGHCPHKKAPGGCQLHNLQCGYPECDRRLLPLEASNG